MSKKTALGTIDHHNSNRRIDYLYRISIKGLIKNEKGEVLVVREAGRKYWDLPGGGMDHGEDIKSAIKRELKEEVNLIGDFQYSIISVDEPAYLAEHDFWQLRLIFDLKPINMSFSKGVDSDKIAFIDPESFKDSGSAVEQQIYKYSKLKI